MIVPELCDFCQLRCTLCWNRNRRGSGRQMELKTVERILEMFGGGRKWGGYSWYNWGEPLLHKHFIEFSEMVKHTKTSISSNFSLPLTDAHFKAFHNIQQMVVSMSGLTPEVYAHYHVGGNHALVMQNLEKLRGHPKVRINWLMHPYNKHQFEMMKDWCAERGWEFGYFRANCEVEELVDGFTHPWIKTQRQYSGRHMQNCKMKKWFLMDVDGNYLVCCGSHNVKVGLSIWDDVTGDEIYAEKIKHPLCVECTKKEYWRMF